jgi:ClpP class serine protease
VDSIGQGRVWSGTRGQEKQLVDELGGLWRSLQIAKAAAGLPAERAVQLVERPGRGAVDLSILQPRLLRDAWGALTGRPVHAPRGTEDAGPEAALVADPSTPLGATAAAFSPAEREFLGQVLRHNGQPLLLVEPFEIRDGSPQP